MSSSAQAKFHLGFIWSALGIALFGGFAIGAHLAAVIGLNFSLGKGFYSFIQIHGHLQLVGWAGLFIIGISLHFIPRLAGVPIALPQWIARIQFLMATGLICRAIFHSILPYVTAPAVFQILALAVAISGWLELAGIASYIFLVLRSLRAVRQTGTERPALQAVKPYFAMMFSGWLIYAGLNAILLVDMAATGAVTVNQPWDDFAINLFIGLVLLPVAFAFSVRMFPLYLRLPAPDWPVRQIGLAYLIFFLLQIIPTVPAVLRAVPETAFLVSAAGQCAKSAIIVCFIWKLDVLLRRRAPWTVNRLFEPGPERPPTRDGLPDYGEFGRFERLLYAAYLWLLVGAGLEFLTGLAVLSKWDLEISTDAIRHVYLLGFITLLIFGMAVRMIPGFIQKKLASAKLVDFTFWLGNLAVIGRVLPLLLPAALFGKISSAIFLSQALFALSGMSGLAAIYCLALNLRLTAKADLTNSN
ncbi:MAG: NnrS family protein [candidate division KSB1 bacterium]|nr:NnrS family protein [candidate division KSB1 bacterium]MDZ7365776.1 NnrS family protein [candidate division KSB1 bacterium]MDZ7403745.1 NnrS family protein [candidate division KSB1 bacterium]